MQNTVILYREGYDYPDEPAAMEKYFSVVYRRSDAPSNSLVIGRYSVLPYYKELTEDLDNINAKLINSYRQHKYLADIGNWYCDLSELTPKTWNQLSQIPERGPFILKGETNSKKFQWDTHMFAATKSDAVEVYCRLQEDSMIGDQVIYIREYIPLKLLGHGLRGLPVSKEFRFFICNGNILCGGFYWSGHTEEINPSETDVSQVPITFLQKVINLVGKNANFWVVDVAQTKAGDWIVIELNDGQMSGLSDNDPDKLYKNLKLSLE